MKNKAETLKTGGGVPEYISIDGPEKELLEVLSLQVEGTPADMDSDSILPKTIITSEMNPEEVNIIVTDAEIAEDELELRNMYMVEEIADPETPVDPGEGNSRNIPTNSVTSSQSSRGKTEVHTLSDTYYRWLSEY
ncbi:uncharacterized protein LOC123315432 [Coccinella septempunctata]|uniref:uncharacterized protein LOC123315432 n=1 Tax=Coccinella septempunctata TaxID=41139 RepID=UPI001D0723C1|nr:uncharacterized protein LOC123315432 [Coccinella septempunctata]